MFDDLQKESQPTGNTPPPVSAMPVNEPPDIFESTDNSSAGAKEKPEIFRPKMPENLNGVENLNILSPEDADMKGDLKSNKIMIAGAIVLVVVLFFVAIWYGYKNFLPMPENSSMESDIVQETRKNEVQIPVGQGSAADTDNTANNSSRTSPPAETPVPTTPATTTETAISNGTSSVSQVNTAPPSPVVNSNDSEGDGLSDDEERKLGTDLNDADTDQDGLYDREEVKVYHTNPLDPDTDNDGFIDGMEVENGYNPAGNGKLYDINR